MTTKRNRRSPEEKIADLEAQLAQVRARAERRKAKADPTLRHVNAAVASIDKALGVSADTATRQALDEARVTLSAILSLNGATPKPTRSPVVQRRAGGQVQTETVLGFVASRPGSRCEDIAAALGADTKAVGPVLKVLKTDGRLRAEGQARGTRYFPGTGAG